MNESALGYCHGAREYLDAVHLLLNLPLECKSQNLLLNVLFSAIKSFYSRFKLKSMISQRLIECNS